MFKNTKSKFMAVILMLAMVLTAIPSGYVKEVQAASKNKVMEVNVDFHADVESGDDTSIYMLVVAANNDITFGKTYELKMKIYVPATFMKKGSFWINPSIDLWTGEDLETYAGCARSSESFCLDINSEEVTKYNDFYVMDLSMPLDIFYEGEEWSEIDAPEGNGQAIASFFISGSNEKDYKGSIYFDDVEILVDGTPVSTVDYENGKTGECEYIQNGDWDNRYIPKVVSFSGKALEVSKTSLTVKKGKKVTIKATATPSSKITYTSSNKKVATVTSKGVVKGIKKGKATITVKANGKTIKVKVTVK
ncbi:MAG: Ig-like domain-containing protein [Lachnospiraceae bacterium]